MTSLAFDSPSPLYSSPMSPSPFYNLPVIQFIDSSRKNKTKTSRRFVLCLLICIVFLLLLVSMLVFMVSSCVNLVPIDSSQSFRLRDQQYSIIIKINNGDVRFSPTSGNEIVVITTTKAAQDSHANVSFSGSTLTIEEPEPSFFSQLHVCDSFSYDIRVPSNRDLFKMSITAGDGIIDLTGLSSVTLGSLSLDVARANIRSDRLQLSSLDLFQSSGSIELGNLHVITSKITSSSGSVSIKSIVAVDLSVLTSSGNQDFRSIAAQTSSLRSSRGNIVVGNLLNGNYTFNSLSGNMNLGIDVEWSGYLDFYSSTGSVSMAEHRFIPDQQSTHRRRGSIVSSSGSMDHNWLIYGRSTLGHVTIDVM
ncbi:hypothetical protein GEMRC1_008721 [Eukaryota sp. GEM-RC1]